MTSSLEHIYHKSTIRKRDKVYRYLSLNVWGNFPSPLQRGVSKVYTKIYDKKFSKLIIKPYCKMHYSDPNYIDQFVSASGSENFRSFQDFFTRKFKEIPKTEDSVVWPCEGLLCEYGRVSDFETVKIKGDRRKISTIFGIEDDMLPSDYFFSNIFLHNNNYHRIHSPIVGTVRRIQKVEGDLVLLRPWAYKKPSTPALRNERVNIDIEDENGQIWYLSIVGGPAVGTIVLDSQLKLGSKVNIVEELGTFLLGSTLCMATPEAMKSDALGSTVYMGTTY